jgi:hypothetical protein
MGLTQQDRENYGDEFLDLTMRAAAEAVSPALNQLRAENQQLRSMAQRAQRAEIERALDREVPGWRERIYADPRFAEWLSEQDPYNDGTRSHYLRRAVAAGDAHRVIRFYQGFLQESGHSVGHQRSYQSRQTAIGGKRIYGRDEIASLYKKRRDGFIDDKSWAQIEADIFAAGREGRVAGALNLTDGTALSRLA